MTPYQANLVIRGKMEEQIKSAWYVAALSRQKKLQPLDALLGKKKDEESLKSFLRGFSRKKIA